MMKLIFVYNAGSGKLNALFDMAHKIVSPTTYECSLCALTHDAFQDIGKLESVDELIEAIQRLGSE